MKAWLLFLFIAAASPVWLYFLFVVIPGLWADPPAMLAFAAIGMVLYPLLKALEAWLRPNPWRHRRRSRHTCSG